MVFYLGPVGVCAGHTGAVPLPGNFRENTYRSIFCSGGLFYARLTRGWGLASFADALPLVCYYACEARQALHDAGLFTFFKVLRVSYVCGGNFLHQSAGQVLGLQSRQFRVSGGPCRCLLSPLGPVPVIILCAQCERHVTSHYCLDVLPGAWSWSMRRAHSRN